jgi:hypothetical protein
MANFLELNAARDKSKAQRLFSRIHTPPVGNVQLDHNDAERQLVDSSDATKNTSDILEQPHLGCGQPKETEIKVDFDIYDSLPFGLEVQSTETQGRGLWSRKKRQAGSSFQSYVFDKLTSHRRNYIHGGATNGLLVHPPFGHSLFHVLY